CRGAQVSLDGCEDHRTWEFEAGFARSNAIAMTSPALSGLRVEPDHGQCAERNKYCESSELCYDKRRFRLRRRQRLQERELLKRLHHCDEDVEVKRRDCARNVNPAPCALKIEDIKRGGGHAQQNERNRADRACRIEAKRRQGEARHTGENS